MGRAIFGKCLRAMRILLLVLAALSLNAASANASDWEPQLLGEVDQWGPQDPVRIVLPELSMEVLQRLSLELDDIDVTQMVYREGDQAVFEPVQPLSWGTHVLRIVEWLDDGQVVERGAWVLDVRKNKRFREVALESYLTVDATRRIATHHIDEPPAHTHTTGSAVFQGAVGDDDWRVTGYMPLVFDSESDNMERRSLDAGDFLFTGEKGPVLVQVGHHRVGAETLAMSSFYRRGVSMTLSSEATNSQLTAFALRGTPVSGFVDGLGVGKSRNRVSGVSWEGQPFDLPGGILDLTGVYLTGNSPEIGSGVAGDDLEVGGTAWSTRADAALWNNRVRLRGEYSRSNYDFDGRSGADAEQDHAYEVFLTVNPLQSFYVLEQPMDWLVGAEHRRVGTFFRSPGNPGASSDRRLYRGFSSFSWYGFGLEGAIAQEKDNVNRLSSIPRSRTDLGWVNASYAPQNLVDPSSAWGRFLGAPSLTAGYSQERVRPDDVPAGYAFALYDAMTRESYGILDFSAQYWSWSLSFRRTIEEDFGGLFDDAETDSSALNVSIPVGGYVSVNGRIQYDETDYLDLKLGDKALLAGAGLSFSDPTNRFFGSIQYDLNRPRRTDDSVDELMQVVTANVGWRAVLAEGLRPGLTLSLDGTWNDFDDDVSPALDLSQWRVFIRATVEWSAAY